MPCSSASATSPATTSSRPAATAGSSDGCGRSRSAHGGRGLTCPPDHAGGRLRRARYRPRPSAAVTRPQRRRADLLSRAGPRSVPQTPPAPHLRHWVLRAAGRPLHRTARRARDVASGFATSFVNTSVIQPIRAVEEHAALIDAWLGVLSRLGFHAQHLATTGSLSIWHRAPVCGITLRFQHGELTFGDAVLLWNADAPAFLATDIGSGLERLRWALTRRPWPEVVYGALAGQVDCRVLDARADEHPDHGFRYQPVPARTRPRRPPAAARRSRTDRRSRPEPRHPLGARVLEPVPVAGDRDEVIPAADLTSRSAGSPHQRRRPVRRLASSSRSRLYFPTNFPSQVTREVHAPRRAVGAACVGSRPATPRTTGRRCDSDRSSRECGYLGVRVGVQPVSRVVSTTVPSARRPATAANSGRRTRSEPWPVQSLGRDPQQFG